MDPTASTNQTRPNDPCICFALSLCSRDCLEPSKTLLPLLLRKQFGGDSFEELYTNIRIPLSLKINRLPRRRPFLPQFRHPPPPLPTGAARGGFPPPPPPPHKAPFSKVLWGLSRAVSPSLCSALLRRPLLPSSKRTPLDTSLSFLQSRGNTSCLWKRGGNKVSQQQPLFHSASVSGDRIVGRERGSELILSGKKIPNAWDRWRPRPAVLNTTKRERERERELLVHTRRLLWERYSG